jgi:hypothetical protein
MLISNKMEFILKFHKQYSFCVETFHKDINFS